MACETVSFGQRPRDNPSVDEVYDERGGNDNGDGMRGRLFNIW